MHFIVILFDLIPEPMNSTTKQNRIIEIRKVFIFIFLAKFHCYTDSFLADLLIKQVLAKKQTASLSVK